MRAPVFTIFQSSLLNKVCKGVAARARHEFKQNSRLHPVGHFWGVGGSFLFGVAMILYFKRNPGGEDTRLFIAEEEDFNDKLWGGCIPALREKFLMKPVATFFDPAHVNWCSWAREKADELVSRMLGRDFTVPGEDGTEEPCTWFTYERYQFRNDPKLMLSGAHGLFLALRGGTDWAIVTDIDLKVKLPELFPEAPKPSFQFVPEPESDIYRKGTPNPAEPVKPEGSHGKKPPAPSPERGPWSWDTRRTLAMLASKNLKSSHNPMRRFKVSPKSHNNYSRLSISDVLWEYAGTIMINFIIARDAEYSPTEDEFMEALDAIMTSCKHPRAIEAWKHFRGLSEGKMRARFRTVILGEDQNSPWDLDYYLSKLKQRGGDPGRGSFPKKVEEVIRRMEKEPWLKTATHKELVKHKIGNNTARGFMQARKLILKEQKAGEK